MYRLSLDSNRYGYADLFWILYRVFYEARPHKTNKHVAYYDVPCAFDIETTSFCDGDEKRAVMYVWMLCLGGYVVVGRTWDELARVFDKIVSYCGLCKGVRLCVYVHNLAYEFQYMRNHFAWQKVFALDVRKPVYAVTVDGLEFRCSYLLSGYSLARLGRGLHKYHVRKMVGDLDYTLMRHSETPLTEQEWGYCVNDVLVVTAYIQETMEREGSIADIPITKTGYVRRFCKRRCLGTSKHRNMDYRRRIHNMTITPEEYQMLKRAFQGGFTHANAYHSGKVLHDVASYDFTSSYPTVMVAERFPMSKGEKILIDNMPDFDFNLARYCCMFDVRFIGLSASVTHENYISLSRCWGVVGAVTNNGRVVSADELCTTITEQDYMIIKTLYKWDAIEVGTFYRYRRDYLPTEFVSAVLELYKDKTTLKGVAGSEVEYMLKKEMLNSCYGMTVTDICRDEIIYDGDWSTESPDLEKALDKYNDARSRFLFYPWGVWITAYARRNLFTGIVSVGSDYVYSDTDSIKMLNKSKHYSYIESYNRKITNAMAGAMEHHGLDLSETSPRTQDGVPKPLGVWDYEGTYSTFKTLGAKRYLTKDAEGHHMTVAGLSKRDGLKWLLFNDTNDDWVFDEFSGDMHIPEGHTGKMLHTYIDEPHEGVMTDYLGNVAEWHESSAVHLAPIDYSLSIGAAYADYLLGIREGMM